eukprot:TRINITY_DN5431_c0_g1_i1.p1 TRINITY_DN5431_c0_g1~~TRINITY_DN5431_c0_g1_i1.p1  ORF type:complete len:913 (+),score=123.02 TRINITY_DN5431_c0_g1_i1:150-2888(+)
MGCSSSAVHTDAFSIGERVYYVGATRIVSTGIYPVSPRDNFQGAELRHGMSGEVVGETRKGDILVTFTEEIKKIKVHPLVLSHKRPVLPEGFQLGEEVYYGGPSRRYPNGDRLNFGDAGRVAGCSCVGDGMDKDRVAVSFQGHETAKALQLALLSREAPVLPGDYSVGDTVYWCGMSWTFPNGDKLRFGTRGQVVGRAFVGDGQDGERVAVSFPGNNGAVAMRLPEISREPPVIPGGYKIGDRVYYTHPNWKAPDGLVLTFGVQGKLIGRSCIGDGRDDERAWVLFAGLGYGCIRLEQISREPPTIPGDYKLGTKVYYRGPSRPVGKDGDRLSFGAIGEVAGRAQRADVAVLFDGNADVTDVRLAQISSEPPVLPMELHAGETVFYTGNGWSSSSGERVTFGTRCEVAGCSCQGDDRDEERIAVRLRRSQNGSVLLLELSDISREQPPRLAERLEEQLAIAAREDDIFVVSATYATARDGGLPGIAESARKKSHAFLEHCLQHQDVAALSQAQRAAEDVQWQDLSESAAFALEQVILPRALASTEGSGDAFGQWSLMQRAELRGLDSMVKRATASLRGSCMADLEDLAEMQEAGSTASTRTSTRSPYSSSSDISFDRQLSPSRLEPPTPVTPVASKAAVGQRFAEGFACDGDLLLKRYEQAAARRHSESGLSVGSFGERTEVSLVRQMQKLVDETYTGWGGYGRQTRTRDRQSDAAANRIEVVSVEHLRNPEKYLHYCMRREVVAAEMPGAQSRSDWDVKTVQAASLLPEVQPADMRVNEHYLWHGTGPNEAKSIAVSGFDLGHAGSGRGSLFGRGLYFAESCLKADEYVKADQLGRYPLILCRTTLGRVHYCDVEDPWELREALRASCRTGSGSYHSVIGDREKVRQTFREFVVFDSSQVYPEFIVWYVRK